MAVKSLVRSPSVNPHVIRLRFPHAITSTRIGHMSALDDVRHQQINRDRARICAVNEKQNI